MLVCYVKVLSCSEHSYSKKRTLLNARMSKNKKGNEKKSFQINVWIAPVTEQWKLAITGTEGEVGAPPPVHNCVCSLRNHTDPQLAASLGGSSKIVQLIVVSGTHCCVT